MQVFQFGSGSLVVNRNGQRSIRLLPSQWAKFDAAGGIEWLRGLIDRSKPKGLPDKS